MPEVTLITTSQVADIFKVNTSAVRKWVADGKLKPAVTTPGGHFRFSLSDVDALATRQATA
jgi:excisionase family DNA binding protein